MDYLRRAIGSATEMCVTPGVPIHAYARTKIDSSGFLILIFGEFVEVNCHRFFYEIPVQPHFKIEETVGGISE